MGRPKQGWTSQRRRAAALLAEGSRTKVDIAAELGVTDNTINNWQKLDFFQAAVDSIVEQRIREERARAINDISSKIGHENPWVSLNASAALLREFNTVTGAGQQQIVVTFGSETVTPGTPVNEDSALPE